jgi:hypothetical protein
VQSGFEQLCCANVADAVEGGDFGGVSWLQGDDIIRYKEKKKKKKNKLATDQAQPDK